MSVDLPEEHHFILDKKMKAALSKFTWDLQGRRLFAYLSTCSISGDSDEFGQGEILAAGRGWPLDFTYPEFIAILKQVPASKIKSVKTAIASASNAEDIFRTFLPFIQWVLEKYLLTVELKKEQNDE